jgi:hypothetical protein
MDDCAQAASVAAANATANSRGAFRTHEDLLLMTDDTFVLPHPDTTGLKGEPWLENGQAEQHITFSFECDCSATVGGPIAQPRSAVAVFKDAPLSSSVFTHSIAAEMGGAACAVGTKPPSRE